MIHFVHAHEPAGKLKHVVAEGDDDELCVLSAFFDVRGYDGYLGCVSFNNPRGMLVVGGTYVAEIERSVNLIHDI